MEFGEVLFVLFGAEFGCEVFHGFRVQGLGFKVQGSGFRVQGSGFKVQGSGFFVRIQRFEVWRFGFTALVDLDC
jgi:hypothetical protein